jgi:steroid 5-alpha reductase family enzyme
LLLTSGHPFLSGLFVAAGLFSAVWILSVVLRDAGIVDIFWGLGFIVIGWFYAWTTGDEPTIRGLLACALTTVWGLRLALHIAVRNAGRGEDHRYAAWREADPTNFWWISFFKVFLLQAVILWVVSSPLLLAQQQAPTAALRGFDLLAITLWLFGFTFESVADWQLMRFKRDPRSSGKILQDGLWGLSRHPNYFGEAVLWWGLGLLALPSGGLLSLIGPVLITFLLLEVSGVALLERAMVERRPAYAAYVRSTPAFLPIPRALRRRRSRD